MLEIIKNLGLDENEAKVYLALLELGPSLVTQISKKAGINRTTSYDVLERLVMHNLVSYASGQKTKKKYSALSPYNLVSFLERKQKQQEKQLGQLKAKLPELKMLYKELQKPSIKFFENIEGVKAIYLETLKAKSEILCVGDCEEWDSADLKAWGAEYNRKRARAKIHERLLVPVGEKTLNWFKNYPAPLTYTHYRVLPKERIPFCFHGEMNVYDDKVVIVLLKKPNRLGIMITSPDLVNMLKAAFEMAWEAAGHYGPTNPFQLKRRGSKTKNKTL